MSSPEQASSEWTLENIVEGYDYVFVGGLPSGEYTCLICSLIAREAHQVSCCGKIFCKPCLETSPKVEGSCPNCRAELRGNWFQDKRAIYNINQLKVYCRNQQQGCTWNGELCRVETHHDDCPYRPVQCPNQCTEAIRSKDLQQHLESECPNRVVECGHCKQVGKHAYISTDHLEDCPDLQIDCPNKGCQEKPKRRNVGAHCQQCPKETVSCEYARIGCERAACLREDMASHNESQMLGHLHLAMNELKTVRTLLESRAEAPQKHVIKMTNFSKLKERSEPWYSPSFYAFPGGYKMCLKVFAGGYGDGEGEYISANLCLMAGVNDQNLEWPMRGVFSVELLNQEQDENHKQSSIRFNQPNPEEWNSKVDKGRAPYGWGIHKLFKHQDLEKGSIPSHTQYLKNDTLYFRVTMTKKISDSKPWLAGAISS